MSAPSVTMFLLPVGLLDELGDEATRLSLDLETLVYRLVQRQLPVTLGTAAQAFLEAAEARS